MKESTHKEDRTSQCTLFIFFAVLRSSLIHELVDFEITVSCCEIIA